MALLSCDLAIAYDVKETCLPSIRNCDTSGRTISLSCENGNTTVSIQWNTEIGSAGKLRRHLVMPTQKDIHYLLKVQPGKTETGIFDDSMQARSFIKTILNSIKKDYFIIEVFPEGRNSATGEWEGAWFKFREFQKAAKSVASECNWKTSDPIDVEVNSVYPGQPYSE